MDVIISVVIVESRGNKRRLLHPTNRNAEEVMPLTMPEPLLRAYLRKS